MVLAEIRHINPMYLQITPLRPNILQNQQNGQNHDRDHDHVVIPIPTLIPTPTPTPTLILILILILTPIPCIPTQNQTAQNHTHPSFLLSTLLL